MSIKHGLLALLDQGPRYGYQLRAEFESRTGSTWPLNVGQVYSTLGRLDRDGLVVPDGEDGEGHVFYRITDEGRRELLTWFEEPVSRAGRPRDELAIKLAMVVTVSGVDIADVVQRQRSHTLCALQDYTRLKADNREPRNRSGTPTGHRRAGARTARAGTHVRNRRDPGAEPGRRGPVRRGG